MSAVLMVSSAMCRVLLVRCVAVLEGVAELVEAAADGAVDDGVADLGDEAALDGRVDDDLDLDLLAGGLAEGSARRVFWSSVRAMAERTSATSLLASAARHGDQLVDDGRQVAGPAVADHQRTRYRGRLGLAVEQVDDDLLAHGRRAGAGRRGLSRSSSLPSQHLGDPEQLVLDLAEVALGPGDREERLGVRLGAVVGHQLLVPTWSM